MFVLVLLGCAALAGGVNGAEPNGLRPGWLVRTHFVGGNNLGSDANANRCREMAEAPASVAFQAQVLAKLAAAPHQLLQSRLNLPAADQAALWRPLWEDVGRLESNFEVGSPGNGALEWNLAVRLGQERAALWSTNLWQLATAWSLGEPEPSAATGALGWQVKIPSSGDTLRVLQTSGWCLVGLGREPWPAQQAWVQAIHKRQRIREDESNAWLTAQVSLARLVQWTGPLPWLKFGLQPLPQINFDLSSETNHLRSRITAQYAEPQTWILEPWRIPTNSVVDPLISFTALQGFRPLLTGLGLAEGLDLKPVSNQLILWAHANLAFRTFAAVQVSQPTNVLARLAETLIPRVNTNLAQHKIGQLLWLTNETRIAWVGLPIVVPSLFPAPQPSGDFIELSLFAPPDSTNPPPPELFSQLLGRTNLLYYDWEITQERLPQVEILHQIYQIVNPQPWTTLNPDVNRTNSSAQPWLKTIGRFLGNTVTEVAVTSPRELSLNRKSHIGFTSLELLLLANWLDDPRFPLFGYRLPPRPKGSTADAQP